MSWKTNLLIGATAVGFAMGGTQVLTAKTGQDTDKIREGQSVEQGSDAQEIERERRRVELETSLDTETGRQVGTGQRPPEPPKIRLRP